MVLAASEPSRAAHVTSASDLPADLLRNPNAVGWLSLSASFILFEEMLDRGMPGQDFLWDGYASRSVALKLKDRKGRSIPGASARALNPTPENRTRLGLFGFSVRAQPHRSLPVTARLFGD